MLQVITVILLGWLFFVWDSRTVIDKSIKLALCSVCLWHLFTMLEASGYIVKNPHTPVHSSTLIK